MKSMKSMTPLTTRRATGARPAAAARNRGFSLIEVLVAITIFAIGFLALAGLQVSGLRATQVGNYRSLAMFHAQTIADQMRANRIALRLDNNPYYSDPSGSSSTAATPEERALLDAQTDVDDAQANVDAHAECTAAQTAHDAAEDIWWPDGGVESTDPVIVAAYLAAVQTQNELCSTSALGGTTVSEAQTALTTANGLFTTARQNAVAAGLDAAAILGNVQQAAAATHTCTKAATICTTEQLAQYEIQSWRLAIAASLPQGQGIVCIDSTPDDGDPSDWMCDASGDVVAIKLSWLEQAAVGAEAGGTLLSSERQRLVVRVAHM